MINNRGQILGRTTQDGVSQVAFWEINARG
jgi:hypothetical protein